MQENEIASLEKLENKIVDGEISLSDIIRKELDNIQSYNKRLNAFITIFEYDSTFIQKQLDEKEIQIRDGRKSNLAEKSARPSELVGIPFTIKDNTYLAGHRTTAGSGVFQKFISNTNADIVDAMMRHGSIPLGKTNLHELAMGATSSSSFFGPVGNPFDSKRISGGSSGGSAVSVAMAKLPIVSIGTDTGGSVRIPAALCGVCGFKPTISTFSTSGIFPLSATLDHVGLFTKTMADMKFAFRSLAINTPKRMEAAAFEPRKTRKRQRQQVIAIPNDYYFESIDKTVSKAFWNVIDKLRKRDQFKVVEDIEIPFFSKVSRIRKSIQLKEAAWFYSELVEKPGLRKLGQADVMGFFEAGSKISMLEYMVSTVQRLSYMAELGKLFGRFDFIAMPTCLITAPKIEEVRGRESGEIRSQLVRNTEPFNLAGLPAVSIPSSNYTTAVSALPTAIQIAGRAGEDFAVLEMGDTVWNCIHGK